KAASDSMSLDLSRIPRVRRPAFDVHAELSYNRNMLTAFILGSLIGFVSAVPVAGPVSAIIFSYGMRGRNLQGSSVALGAGLGEGVYTALAFWGFTQLFLGHPTLLNASQFVAASVLLVLGIYFYRSQR